MQLDKKLRRTFIRIKEGEFEYKFNPRMVELYKEISALGKNSASHKKIKKKNKAVKCRKKAKNY